jgi:hypothetical protein
MDTVDRGPNMVNSNRDHKVPEVVHVLVLLLVLVLL